MIQRERYLNKLINKKNNGRVKIITGIRRCGKSYLLFNLYKNYLLSLGIKEEQILSFALDSVDDMEFRHPLRLNEYIKEKTKNKKKKYYIFIDEIQFSFALPNPYSENQEDKITFVDVLLGLMKQEHLDIYVTGSNSKMLSKDILTQFRDRGDEIKVQPLSFAESYPLYANSSMALQEYMIYGGMPYVFSLKNEEEKAEYLKKLFQETYIKDILERNRIYNEKEILEVLLNFTSSAIGSLTNPSKLSKRFLSEKKVNINSHTLSNYLEYFEDAYILSSAHRFDVKGSRYFSTPLKYYFSDLGLRNARLNFRQIEETHLMENLLYNELILRGYNVDVGVVEQEIVREGVRKKVQLEVDFVVNKGSQRVYIQSALSVESPEKKEQEIASLKKISDAFKKIVVLRHSIVPRYDENGIFYVGLEEFLLNEDYV